MADIRRFAVEETSVLELREANDEPMIGEDKSPVTVTLFGPGSQQYAKAEAARSNRLVNKLTRKGKAEETAEQKAKERAEFLAACTKEFSPNLTYDDLTGVPLFKAVYADITIGFIAEQVGKHLGDWANFTKGSSKP